MATRRQAAPVYCARCKERIYDAQEAYERISDGYIPLRGKGANQVRYYVRTGAAFHALCLDEHVRGEQMQIPGFDWHA